MTKAWRVTVWGFPTVMVSAETRGKAAARVLRSLRDAHYRVKYTELKVHRHYGPATERPEEYYETLHRQG